MEADISFLDVINKRRSIRKFKKQKVARELIDQLLHAIQSSPTAGNLQAYKVYLVEDPKKIKTLGMAAFNQECVSRAPAVLVFCTDPRRSAVEYGERGEKIYCLYDATIAITIAHLTTLALGLGSVMVGAFNEKVAAEIIGTPPNIFPMLLLPIGYPDEQPERTDRRAIEDLVVRL
jgi:nitroreductase